MTCSFSQVTVVSMTVASLPGDRDPLARWTRSFRAQWLWLQCDQEAGYLYCISWFYTALSRCAIDYCRPDACYSSVTSGAVVLQVAELLNCSFEAMRRHSQNLCPHCVCIWFDVTHCFLCAQCAAAAATGCKGVES